MNAVVLFVKDHISFLIFQGMLVLFLILLFWLDGFRNYYTAIYAIILSILFTFGFLVAKFVLRRSFYAAIVIPPENIEHALIRHAQGPEHIATAAFTRSLYKLYQNEVQTLYATQNRQLEFITQWVHQMKTPISVINLLLQEKEGLDRVSIAEEVGRIQSGLDLVLVNARLETFEEDMTIERVRLKTMVEEILTKNKRLLITNGVYPVLSIDETFIVATDVKWMKIVISQFITNAVKYSFDSGKKIHLTANSAGQGILLSIRDEGIGIPASDLNRVTRAFFTGENGRLTGESTGMGLYIASEICVNLGHELQIYSELGTGTTVTVLFKNGKSEEKNDSENHGEFGRSNESL